MMVSTACPKDVVCSGDITLCSIEVNGDHGPFFITGSSVDNAIMMYGRGDNVVRETSCLPNNFPAGQIVCSNCVCRTDDE